MNKILIGLLALSVAGNIYFLVKPSEIIVKKSEPEKKVVTEIETIKVQDKSTLNKLDLANEKIAGLEKELLKLRAELDLIKDREALDKLSKQIDQELLESLDTKVSKQAAAEALAKRTNMVKELFEKESVNESWAYQTQDAITNTIYAHGDTSLYEIKELVCKSTVCKMELKPFSNSKGVEMMVSINASMAFNENEHLREFKRNFHFDTYKASGVLEVYISK